MVFYEAFHFLTYSFLNTVLVLSVLTLTSCYVPQCRQRPCSFPITAPFLNTSLQQHAQLESTSNALNPLIDHQLTEDYLAIQENEIAPPISKLKNVPDYMLNIYSQKIHRSGSGKIFDNVRIYRANLVKENGYLEKIYQRSNISIVHHLLFNAIGLSLDESLAEAELKLWALIHSSPENLLGARRLFRIYLTNGYSYNPWDLEILDFKIVFESKNLWLTFNVTHAVRWWIDHNIPLKIIQVRIDPVQLSDATFGFIDISLKPVNGGQTEPQLVIYSSSNKAPEESRTIAKRDSHRDRRSTNKVHRKNRPTSSCRRRSLYVNFTQINYDQWIIAPEGFEAYECVGRCDFPLSDHLTPSRHSVIQSLVHATQPDKVGKVCCVPVRLEPISLLYFDDQDVLTYKYRYDEMVVAECGCR